MLFYGLTNNCYEHSPRQDAQQRSAALGAARSRAARLRTAARSRASKSGAEVTDRRVPLGNAERTAPPQRLPVCARGAAARCHGGAPGGSGTAAAGAPRCPGSSRSCSARSPTAPFPLPATGAAGRGCTRCSPQSGASEGQTGEIRNCPIRAACLDPG